MGTSFVLYNDAGFWVRDGDLQVWLAVLVLEIDRRAPLDDFLQGLRSAWEREAMNEGVGVIWVDLDKWADSEAHKALIIELCTAGIAFAKSLKDGLRISELKKLPYPLGDQWRYSKDDDIGTFYYLAPLGEYFIKLLSGEIVQKLQELRYT